MKIFISPSSSLWVIVIHRTRNVRSGVKRFMSSSIIYNPWKMQVATFLPHSCCHPHLSLQNLQLIGCLHKNRSRHLLEVVPANGQFRSIFLSSTTRPSLSKPSLHQLIVNFTFESRPPSPCSGFVYLQHPPCVGRNKFLSYGNDVDNLFLDL
jgi:hypothetical protein